MEEFFQESRNFFWEGEVVVCCVLHKRDCRLTAWGEKSRKRALCAISERSKILVHCNDAQTYGLQSDPGLYTDIGIIGYGFVVKQLEQHFLSRCSCCHTVRRLAHNAWACLKFLQQPLKFAR